MSISGALRGRGSGSHWTGAAKRSGRQAAREIEIGAKRRMPAWDRIMPAIVRAFLVLRETGLGRDEPEPLPRPRPHRVQAR